LADLSTHLSQEHLESAHATLADLYASRSLALYDLAAARQRITQAISNLGLTLEETGDTTGAEKQLRLAIDLSERLGSARQGVLARVALADLFLKRQEHQQAEHLALEAQAFCRLDGEGAVNDQALYGRVLVTLGDIYRATDRLNEADSMFKQAIDILKREHEDEHLGRAYFHYSELLNQLGKHAEGYELVKQAYLLGKRGTTTPSLPVRN
ncbi:MAG TPA: tetratricopeptide repeat protein, partial [Ktedonobacterales bacterium]|nr:tetratricopeptide repeat protein [Ktedonobacterales bacterium]